MFARLPAAIVATLLAVLLLAAPRITRPGRRIDRQPFFFPLGADRFAEFFGRGGSFDRRVDRRCQEQIDDEQQHHRPEAGKLRIEFEPES